MIRTAGRMLGPALRPHRDLQVFVRTNFKYWRRGQDKSLFTFVKTSRPKEPRLVRGIVDTGRSKKLRETEQMRLLAVTLATAASVGLAGSAMGDTAQRWQLAQSTGAQSGGSSQGGQS